MFKSILISVLLNLFSYSVSADCIDFSGTYTDEKGQSQEVVQVGCEKITVDGSEFILDGVERPTMRGGRVAYYTQARLNGNTLSTVLRMAARPISLSLSLTFKNNGNIVVTDDNGIETWVRQGSFQSGVRNYLETDQGFHSESLANVSLGSAAGCVSEAAAYNVTQETPNFYKLKNLCSQKVHVFLLRRRPYSTDGVSQLWDEKQGQCYRPTALSTMQSMGPFYKRTRKADIEKFVWWACYDGDQACYEQSQAECRETVGTRKEFN